MARQIENDVRPVNRPARLLVDKMQSPNGGHSRAPVTACFHVSDTAKHSVSGARVYVVGLPYGWIRKVPEQATDATGWVTMTPNPTVMAAALTGTSCGTFGGWATVTLTGGAAATVPAGHC